MKTRSVSLSGFTLDVEPPYGPTIPLTFHRTGSQDPHPSSIHSTEVWPLVRALLTRWARIEMQYRYYRTRRTVRRIIKKTH